MCSVKKTWSEVPALRRAIYSVRNGCRATTFTTDSPVRTTNVKLVHAAHDVNVVQFRVELLGEGPFDAVANLEPVKCIVGALTEIGYPPVGRLQRTTRPILVGILLARSRTRSEETSEG